MKNFLEAFNLLLFTSGGLGSMIRYIIVLFGGLSFTSYLFLPDFILDDIPFSSHFLFILQRENKKRLKKESEKLPEEN